jgi:hypothetical protein
MMRPLPLRPLLAGLALLALPVVLPAQNRVRLAVLGENDRPLPYLRLTVSGTAAPVETQDNGECWVVFPAGQSALTVFPPDNYELVSPPDGRIVQPGDPGQTVRIWLAPKSSGTATPGGSDRAVRLALDVAAKKAGQMERLRLESEQLRRQLAALEQARAASGAEAERRRVELDSLRGVMARQQNASSQLQLELDALREQIGLKRQAVYAAISGDLLIYLDRLKDLRDALPRAGDAFIDQRIGQRFERTIEQYNTARDSILRHYAGQIELSRQLWSPAPAAALATVYDKILTDTHQRLVLPLNDELMTLFRAVRTGDTRPAAARKKAKKVGNEAFGRLNAVIPLLERDVREALDRLNREP